MPDYSPWGAAAMSGTQNWMPQSPTAPTPTPATPASAPGTGISAPNPMSGQPGTGGGMTMSLPPSGGNGTPPAPRLPGTGVAMPAPPPTPTPQPAQPNAMGMAAQPGVSGLGPLLQMLGGGGNRAGVNPIQSLIQLLQQRGMQPGGTMVTPINSPRQYVPPGGQVQFGGQPPPVLGGGGGITSPIPPGMPAQQPQAPQGQSPNGRGGGQGAGQPVPGGVQGMPAQNPQAAQMNALLMQQMMPSLMRSLTGIQQGNPTQQGMASLLGPLMQGR